MKQKLTKQKVKMNMTGNGTNYYHDAVRSPQHPFWVFHQNSTTESYYETSDKPTLKIHGL